MNIKKEFEKLLNFIYRKIRTFCYKYIISKRFFEDKKEVQFHIDKLIEVSNCKNISPLNQNIYKVVNIEEIQ